jgi:hypothetical protein
MAIAAVPDAPSTRLLANRLRASYNSPQGQPSDRRDLIMSDIEYVKKTLTLVLSQVQDLERQLVDKKKTANDLCRIIQQPPMFDGVSASPSGFAVRPDEYYGMQALDVIRSILEKRKTANLGAATIAEIHEAMLAGGYQFQTQKAANAKRGLYSLVAVNAIFHRLPNGRIGLTEWYPHARAASEQNGGKQKTRRNTVRARPKAKGRSPAGGPGGAQKTRLTVLRDLLRTNGPMHRNEIREKSGFPEGTVAYLLNEKNFKHESDGRWAVKDEGAARR